NADALSHSVCSSWFAVKADEAVGESYVLALSRLNSAHGGKHALTAGRYLDRFACRSGEWRFTERQFVVDVTIDLGRSTSDESEAGLPGWQTGAADPVHELWRVLVRA
ncbi:MAG TPA: nuclear transport factor 2 family protein, partial [Rhodothermales bacterium]